MLTYTATYMPYQICFLEATSSGFMKVFEYALDVLFGIDIMINFMSAYEGEDGTLEPRLTRIAINYLKLWFFVDIFAVIPVQVFDSSASAAEPTLTPADLASVTVSNYGGNGTLIMGAVSATESTSASYNKLIRIARVARLYRLLRIVRLFKIFKIFRYNQMVQRFMDKIKLNAAAGRMIMILIMGFFSVHLVSCLWFLLAKFRDFDPDTWVYRMKL